jgi:hypothetical protein
VVPSVPNLRLAFVTKVGVAMLVAAFVASAHNVRTANASPGPEKRHHHLFGRSFCGACCAPQPPVSNVGGSWFWMRTPDDEKRAVISLYTRYCLRCHAVDGRGVWDIPGVPDFTNPRFQACLPDAHMVNSIIEGRGACMPPFRGTLSLEEAWAMARYLRTFVPGSEVSRPDFGPANVRPLGGPTLVPPPATVAAPPLPIPESRAPFSR